MNKNPNEFTCPLEITVQLIGGKYKSIILWYLVGKTLRFNELRRLIPSATQKMLTQQLRSLEEDKLVKRVIYPVIPPKVEYSLTDFGKSITPILDVMCNWGENYFKNLGVASCCKKIPLLNK